MSWKSPFLIITLLMVPLIAKSAVVYYQVKSYRNSNQNPFLENLEVQIVYLQDFEEQSKLQTNILSTPYATAWNGGTNGPSWGVAQDRSAEGGGWAWSSNVSNPDWRKEPRGLLFEFSPDEHGRLPEYVGAALLGYNDFENVGGLFNSIFVYDKEGNEITGGEWKLPRLHYTGADAGNIFTDFEGIYFSGGISKIQFRDFADVDHLTYGYAPMPEPGALSLAGVAAVGLLRRRARAGL